MENILIYNRTTGGKALLTRRQFIKLAMASTAALQLSDILIPQLAQAFTGQKRPPVIWLEMMTCTGDFLSVANTLHPNMRQLLFDTIDLHYSNTVMAAEGDTAIDSLMKTVEREKGEFILIAEGTVPLKNGGKYGAIGHHKDGRLFTDLEAIQYIAPKAKHIMAVGTCASFGGPYAARPNPSGSVPVHKVVEQQVINVPGCPVHPDWAVGTLTHLLLFGVPNLDSFNRPTVFYGRRIHDWCPRRKHFDNGVFAEYPGDRKCTYKIGCKGPATFSDCPTRQWIGEHYNWPVGANSQCIGCVNPDFPDGMSPFNNRLPNVGAFGIAAKADNVALGIGGLTALGIGGHLAASVIKGRFGDHFVNGTIPKKEGAIKDIRKHADDHLQEVVFFPENEIKKAYLKTYRLKRKSGGKKNKNIYTRMKNLVGRLTYPDKEAAYSWVKAPRYHGVPFETGPLAHLWMKGDYRNGFSAMDRLMARALEAKFVADLMRQWAKELEIGKPIYRPYEFPDREVTGVGYTGAMRGALGHWVRFKGQKILNYQIVTPSAWVCSPRDDKGQRGPVEEALIGTPVPNAASPIEIGRVARSYDPCLACAVHLLKVDGERVKYQIVC